MAAAVAPRVLYLAEPAPAWERLPPLVVDASVMAAVLWAEPAAETARLRLAGRSLHAPDLMPYELANVARNKQRAGVPVELARAGLLSFAEQRITLHEAEPEALFDLATAHGLTAYDAAYLALALALQAPLLTFDQRLADAATRALGPRDTPPP